MMHPIYCMHLAESRKVLMHPIFRNAQCRGWWCPECNHWVKATGRESGFGPGDWHELKRKLEEEGDLRERLIREDEERRARGEPTVMQMFRSEEEMKNDDPQT